MPGTGEHPEFRKAYKDREELRKAHYDGKFDVDLYGRGRGALLGVLLIAFFASPILVWTDRLLFTWFWSVEIPSDALKLLSFFSFPIAGALAIIAARFTHGCLRGSLLVIAGLVPWLLALIAVPDFDAGVKAFITAPRELYLVITAFAAFTLMFVSGRLRVLFPLSLTARIMGFVAGAGFLAHFLVPGVYLPGKVLAYEVLNSGSVCAILLLLPPMLIALIQMVSVPRLSPGTARWRGSLVVIFTIIYLFAAPWIAFNPMFSALSGFGPGLNFKAAISIFSLGVKEFGPLYANFGLFVVGLIDFLSYILQGAYDKKLRQAELIISQAETGVKA